MVVRRERLTDVPGTPWNMAIRRMRDEQFAYAGWDDPAHELAELAERGVRGRSLGDDVPVDVREQKRLAGQRKRDLRIHETSVEFEQRDAERAQRVKGKASRYRSVRGPTLTAEEREARRLERREQKLVEELKSLGYVVFKMEGPPKSGPPRESGSAPGS